MIGGFAWNGLHEEALLLFIEMMENYDARPNGETFISLAYACAGMGFPQLGKQLHAQVIVNSLAYDDYDGRLSRSLIHMYSSFGIMDFAQYIFNKNMNIYTVKSCNAMINGYIRIGRLEEAQTLFDTIPDRDEISWTSLIDGYLSTGQVSKACYLFNNMPDKDGVAWTAMISGHVQNELFAEATYLFSEMRAYGISPLNSTYSILFGAAGATANIDQGRQIHCMMIKMQSELDLLLENSLISMYAKCGVIDDAYNIFSNMVSRDLVSWNSIIMGFSHHGLASETLQVFESMLESGTHPNSLTFLGVLSACSHAGMVSQGWKLFNAMRDVYAIQPGLEHHVCMINLLGRAGKVKEAEEYVLRLPFEPDHHIWGALLGVCGFGETNAKIAKSAAKRLLELDPLNGPGHVVLCNIYAANGWHVEEQKLRKEMGLKGLRKVPGCSWIILSGKVHMFLSGDKMLVGDWPQNGPGRDLTGGGAFGTPGYAGIGASSLCWEIQDDFELGSSPNSGRVAVEEGHTSFGSDKSFRYSTTHEDITEMQVPDSDSCKAQLLEALRHSQTLVPTAAAKTLYHRIKNNDQPISTLFPVAIPWMPQKGQKLRKNLQKVAKGKRRKQGQPRNDMSKYAVALALGLGLVGAGLLLGWTVGVDVTVLDYVRSKNINQIAAPCED
ncbi:hypothetical protein Q3G72_003518 [Acer saccharum]|nr:hypothetical protein Q3G72_003518 [Acer saccharum]